MRNNHNSGVSLIELILYIGLLSILLLSSSVFLGIILKAKVKSQVISEVEQQGLQVMRKITQTIKNAQKINSPTIGTSASSINLDTFDNAKNPTVFDTSQGLIQITEGVNQPIPLTSTKLEASNLTFQNTSYANTPPIIGIQFTLNFKNPSRANEYNYSQTFNSSASQRTP